MIRTRIIAIGCILGFFGFLGILVPTFSIQASGQETYNIPQWIKNNAKLWSEKQIGDSDFIKGIQYLINNNILHTSISKKDQEMINYAMTLQKENEKLQSDNQNLQTQLKQTQNKINELEDSSLQQSLGNAVEKIKRVSEASKPTTMISDDTINWHFSDSKGNKYDWNMPMTTYDSIVKQPIYIGTWTLNLPDGQTVQTYDYSQFVNEIMARPDFTKVMDQVYNNAGNDDQFVYEVWYIVSEMTTYNKDITNSNLWPLEVFTRGTGDCKDKSILIADMLRSSEHTRNWSIKLQVMDMDNPNNPQTVNHMIVLVNTGLHNYAIESTATPDNDGLNVWAGKQITGWDISA